MRNEREERPEHPSANPGLAEAVSLLTEELRATRLEHRRLRRRLNAMSAALAALLVVTGWSVAPLFSEADTQPPPQARPAPATAEERARQRDELIAMLPPDKRRELETFEREADWLSRYMHTWDQGKAGAVVAIMLFRMAQSMETMPSMEQQMRAMSGQMGALPAIVAELNQINAKMSLISATMDSTMGRAGRMMPWMPFSP